MSKQFKCASEGDVKKRVKRLLTDHGWFWWMPPANGFGRAGIADINALKAGVFMAVETKYAKNKPSVMQLGFLTSVQTESGFAFVVNEDRLAWLEAWLGAFDRSTEAASKQQEPSPEDGAMMLNAMREMTKEL